MAMPSILSHDWVCPGALFPGVGPRLFTFRRGLVKLRASGSTPRPAGFARFVRFSRPNLGSAGVRRFSVPPERAPGAKPSSTTRPPEFTAWVYHALGGGTLETILSSFSILMAFAGIALSLAFQRAQTTGVLPVVGGRAQQAGAAAALSETPDRRQQEETAGGHSASKPMSRSAITAEVDDHDTRSERLAYTASTASTLNMAYRVVPYGMSAADHVYDTPWSNLCRWAVYALQFQEAMDQQAAVPVQPAASPAVQPAAVADASASMVSEQAEIETTPASDAGVPTETADSILAPAATVGAAICMGGSAVEPQVLSDHGLEFGSSTEIRMTTRRTVPVVRVARALLRLSAHVAELPLRIVDWAIQMDQPIRYYQPHVPAPSTKLRDVSNAPADAIATSTVAEVEAGTEPGATPVPVQSVVPRITPLDACVTATSNQAVMSVSDEAVVAVQPLQLQQPPEKKGRDPWVAVTEADEENAFDLEVLEPGMAEMHNPTRDVMTFAKAAADAPAAQLRVYHDEASVMGAQTMGESSTPAAVARLPGGAATAVFAVALSSWLSACAIVLLSRAAAYALGSIAGSQAGGGGGGSSTGRGMSAQEYFGPWYDYVRQMGPGYPRTCVPICTPSPPHDIPAAAIRRAAEAASVAKPPSAAARGGSSSSSSTVSVDHKLQQMPLAQSAVAAVAAVDKDAQEPAVAPAAAVAEPLPRTEPVDPPAVTRADVTVSDAPTTPLSAGIAGTNLEDMAGLLRLLPPPPSRLGWAGSPAAAAGLKPNPPVLTDPTTNWGLTPSSAAAEAAEAEAAAACGKCDLPQDQRRARQRRFSDRLREAVERRITAAAAAAAATAAAAEVATASPALTFDPVELLDLPLASAAAVAGAAGPSPAQADCPGEVTPEVTQANSIPSTPGGDADAFTAVAADTNAADDDIVPEVQDDGANWQLGPACELAVPLAVPFAVPLAVPVPPAVPLPLSAAELAAPPLQSAAKGANPPEAAGSLELPSLQLDSARPRQAQSAPPDAAESPRATEASAAAVDDDDDVVSMPASEAVGQATVKSVVSVPGLHLSTTIRQPGTALVIRYQPPQQQKGSDGSFGSAANAAMGCCGSVDAVDPDPSYEERLREAIKTVLSGAGAQGAPAVSAVADVGGPSANRNDTERQLTDAGLAYMPLMEWGAALSRDVEPDGSESSVTVSGLTARPDSPSAVEISVQRAEQGEESSNSGESSCLLPAVVSQVERGIVKAGRTAPAGVVVHHRSPMTRGSLHSQTVTVTIDADAVHGVSNVQVDVKPSLTTTVSAVEAAVLSGPRATPGVLPPPPATEAPWVLAAPAVTPPAALLPAGSRPASLPPVSAPAPEPANSQSTDRSADPISAAATTAVKASGEDLVTEPEEPSNRLTDNTAVSAAPSSAMGASGQAESLAARGVEWAFYACQYNGMKASELRPYHAPGECDQVKEAPRAVKTAAPVPDEAPISDNGVVEESKQELPRDQRLEDVTPIPGVTVEKATGDGAVSTGTTACEEVLGNGLFNRFIGVPELDRALFTTGGVVPGSWTATGTVKIGGRDDWGAAKKAANAAVAAAAAAAAAADAAAASSGPNARRGLFGSRRRRASLLRLRSEALKAAAVAAARAANAAAVSTLFGVHVDEMFSTSTEDGGSAISNDAKFAPEHEYTDDVLNALVALAAAASGAVSPASVQSATAAPATGKAAEVEGADDVEALTAMVELAAAANGAVWQHSGSLGAAAAAAPVSLAAAPSRSTQAAAPVGDQDDMAELRAQAELAAAANGAVTHEVSGTSAAPVMRAAAVPQASQVASTASETNTGSALEPFPAEDLKEQIDAEGDVAGGRHFLPLASAVAMFNQPRISPASATAAAASIAKTASAEMSSAAAWMPGRDNAASRRKDTKGKKSRAAKVADVPSLVAMPFVLPPAGSLAATAVGLGIAAAAAGAAVVHASDSLEKLEEDDDITDLQAQAELAAAADGAAETQTAAASIPAIEISSDLLRNGPPEPQKVPMVAEVVNTLNVGVGGQRMLREGGGGGGEEDDDCESQLRRSVYIRPEDNWEIDLDLRYGFTGSKPDPSPVGGAATAPLAVQTPASATPAPAAAAAEASLRSPIRLTDNEEAPLKAKEARSATAAAAEEKDEDDETEALRWLAYLMGVAVEGFIAAEEQPLVQKGSAAEKKTLMDRQQATPSTDAGTGVGDVSIAGLPAATNGSPAAAAAAAATAVSDIEFAFGDTEVILPEAPAIPGSATTPIVAAAAALAARPPPPAPYTPYWSVPDSDTLAADVDAFATSESSQEDDGQEGAGRKGEDDAMSSETVPALRILERAQSVRAADIPDLYRLSRPAPGHEEVDEPSDPTDVLIRFLLDLKHDQKGGEVGIGDDDDDELQFGEDYYREEGDDDGYKDFDDEMDDTGAFEDGDRL